MKSRVSLTRIKIMCLIKGANRYTLCAERFCRSLEKSGDSKFMRERDHKVFHIVISIILSFLVHVVIFTFIYWMKPRIAPEVLYEVPKKPSRYLKLSNVELPPTTTPERKSEKRAMLVPSHKKADFTRLEQALSNTVLATAASLAEKNRTKPPLPSPEGTSIIKIHELPLPPEILEINGDTLPPEQILFNRLIVPKIPRDKSTNKLFGEDNKGKNAEFTPSVPIPLSMRISLPKKRPKTELPVQPDTRLLPAEKVSIMDSLMDIKISKYESSDGGGFFRIDIIPNQKVDNNLRAFKKDTVFSIDVSGSISQNKLDAFKEGIKNALNKLDAEDRFEIVAFRHKAYPLFNSLQHPTEENIRQAEDFLFNLTRTGSTNIYCALAPYAGGKYKTIGRPLLLFLSSDGKVNTGEISDSCGLINAISNQNQDIASIFTFSSGQYSNSFLLDLLAYRNSGESFNSDKISESRSGLERFIGDVSDIVVMDLNYQVSSRLSAFTFPKKLPHLCRKHSLSIYGRYPPKTQEVGLRIVGTDNAGRKQELVYAGELQKAGQADSNLPKCWALQYIYHLYSRLTAGYDENLRLEIHKTADRYGIEAPYFDSYLVKGKAFPKLD